MSFLKEGIITISRIATQIIAAMGGISYASAVDIAPQRRVDLGIKYLIQAIGARSHGNERTFEENLAQELILASQNNQESRAIKRKDEIERIAVSAR